MHERLLHIRFWFLVPEYQLQSLGSVELLNLFEAFGVSVHPSPDPALEGYALLSMRLRPPSPDEWKKHSLSIFGITAGLDDIPPYLDLIDAAKTNRENERRNAARAGGVTQEEALTLCHKHYLWNYHLVLAEFHRKHTMHNILLWSVWYTLNAKHPQGIIERGAGEHGRPRFTWLGIEGIWPYRYLIFLKFSAPPILIKDP